MLGSSTRIFFTWSVLWRLLAAFLVPFFLFSVVMTAAADTINESLGQLPIPKVGVVHQKEIPVKLLTALQANTTIIAVEKEADLRTCVENDSIDIGLLFEKQPKEENYKENVVIYYNSMWNARAVREVLELIDDYESQLVALNIKSLKVDNKLINPVNVDKKDTFDSLLLLGRIMKGTRGGISDFFNCLVIVLVLWLARQMVLRTAIDTPKSFKHNLLVTIVGTALGTSLVFGGLQAGLSVELTGMVKSLLMNIQRLIVLDQLYPILILWLPTWLFILGLLGTITTASATQIRAHERTFWVVVGLHFVALCSCASAKTGSIFSIILPIVNVFHLGQQNFGEGINWNNWSVAFGITCVWAIIFLYWWQHYHTKQLLDRVER